LDIHLLETFEKSFQIEVAGKEPVREDR
jgi:hypothetical protein